MANLASIENKFIVEIGPGTGMLTDQIISKNPKKLLLIEKDRNLFMQLIKKYKDIDNIQIINEDALNFNFNSINKSIMFSNLPYNITSKMINKLLKTNNKFNLIILMIQNEVAKKITKGINNKNNKLKFFIESLSSFKLEFNVSKNVFYPKPRVDSAVVSLKPKKILFDKDKLEFFSKEVFKFRRKKITNVIKIDNDSLSEILLSRAEDLDTDQLLKLFKNF